MHNFKNLNVWQKAIDYTVEIYKLSKQFPDEEKYGITSQIRRAAVSISCNISEGAGKSSNKDFNRFLDMALGSANEVENLLIICLKLKYINEEELKLNFKLIREIRKMIVGFQKRLKI